MSKFRIKGNTLRTDVESISEDSTVFTTNSVEAMRKDGTEALDPLRLHAQPFRQCGNMCQQSEVQIKGGLAMDPSQMLVEGRGVTRIFEAGGRTTNF